MSANAKHKAIFAPRVHMMLVLIRVVGEGPKDGGEPDPSGESDPRQLPKSADFAALNSSRHFAPPREPSLCFLGA